MLQGIRLVNKKADEEVIHNDVSCYTAQKFSKH